MISPIILIIAATTIIIVNQLIPATVESWFNLPFKEPQDTSQLKTVGYILAGTGYSLATLQIIIFRKSEPKYLNKWDSKKRKWVNKQ